MENLDISNNEDFDFKETDSHLIDIGIKVAKIDDSLIRLYNLFISSNPDYLYNKTYILDSLDKFKDNILILKNKHKVSFSLVKKFIKLQSMECNWIIIIDDYYIFTSKTNNELMSYVQLKQKIDESTEDTVPSLEYLNKIKNKSEKYINCNNIYNLDKSRCLIRVFSNNQVRLFSYKFENYDKNMEDEIKQKLKAKNIKSRKNLFNQIQDFIDNCNKKVDTEDSTNE